MKRNITILIFIACLNSCVKDPVDITSNQVFSVKVEGVPLENAVILADNTLKYRVELQALDGVTIQDNKSFTVTVSDGNVIAAASNSPATSSSAPVSVIAGKASFFYYPGKKAQPNALLSVTIDGLTQTFNYVLRPSEPTAIQLNLSNSFPTAADNVDVTAVLSKPSGLPSTDLKVNFSVSKPVASDPILVSLNAPQFAYSVLDPLGIIVAKTSIVTNKKPGTVVFTATYLPITGAAISVPITVTYTP